MDHQIMPPMTRLAALLICLAPGALACPAPTDMARGVMVVTMGADGTETRARFRKTAPQRVVETRRTQRMSDTLMLERTLYLGLLPLDQQVIDGDARATARHTGQMSYPDQDLTRLTELRPGLRFTVETRSTWADGRRDSRLTHYALGAERKRRYSGCLLPTIEITAIEKGGLHEITRSYAYFTTLGFAIELSATSAAEASSNTLMSIDKAGN